MNVRVYKKIFESPDNGFCVLVFSTDDGTVPEEARDTRHSGLRIHFTGTGYYIPSKEGTELELEGRWEKDKRRGMQFIVEQFAEVLPKTKAGIIAYLSSGLVKGVGTKTARLIVQKFGQQSLDVMEHHPEKLLAIKGITQGKLDAIMESYRKSRIQREIVASLSPYGVSVAKAAKIQKAFGSQSLEILKHDPYRLCEVPGFGFITVDQIARANQCALDDPLRIRGAVAYVLDKESENGNLFLDKDTLADAVQALLNKDCEPPVVTDGDVKLQVNQMVQTGLLNYDRGALYLPRHYEEETAIAAVVARMLTKTPPKPVSENSIEAAQKSLGILLAPAQAEGVSMALSNRISLLTGGPGTGKTTVLRVILQAFQTEIGGSVLLAAPTGRAGRRMAESCGMEAKTLHSALGLIADEENDYANASFILDYDFVIVDESSMVESRIAKELFTRLKSDCRLLLVGDVDQLPPVGPGCVFRDLIASEVVPVTRLDTIYRQAEGSRIALNAKQIKDGSTTLLYGPDFEFLPTSSAKEAGDLVFQAYQSAIQAEGVENVQILSPLRRNGDASVNSINPIVREAVNPHDPMNAELVQGSRVFRVGDKVLQIRNKDEISNGDVGFVRYVKPEREDEDACIGVEFSGGRFAEYTPDTLHLLDLAYAMSIHKSQGSEYSTVIIPVLYAFHVMLKRDIYYTAITRARKKVILIGQKPALFKAIHAVSDPRNTRLSLRVRERMKALGAKTPEQAPEQLKIG